MQIPTAQMTGVLCLTFFFSALARSAESRSVERRHSTESKERMIREPAALAELKALVKQCNSDKMAKALQNPNIFSEEFQLLRKCLALLQILRPESDVEITTSVSVDERPTPAHRHRNQHAKKSRESSASDDLSFV
ncbi:unnamed protein product [Bursaphelenchus xylophilus]|uniref:(pine wood nematode) hypothetical protein n=1 Tax=Bursaphelenchus xylophilus TaxID=6326 RepID=A0A1I7SD42_BURXY|nr:unnamed protein product [Bursaphelenchus xylophilus]CAG9092961.1 unnamed protein product [Bursaphelenchus xylophilus]